MMDALIELLVAQPLLLLFVVAGIGYALGRITIRGSSLGVAAVLFVGLAVGALDARLVLPDVIFLLGLVIFVYTIGLSSGPGFFASFNPRGLRDNLLVLAMVLLAAGLTWAAHAWLGIRSTVAAGMFAGALTNTPTLAGVLDVLRSQGANDAILAEPVVGYSVAYPMGVLSMIFVIAICRRLWRIDDAHEADRLRHLNLVEQEFYSRTVRVTQPDVIGIPIRDLVEQRHWGVMFTRVRRGEQVFVVDAAATVLQLGDLVTVLGAPANVDRIGAQLGEPSEMRLELDRSLLDYRRIFVSNPDVVGRRLAQLRLPQRYGALVTRVRRGDIDLPADGDTVLELGDRVRVVAARERMPEIGRLFGDSYKALSEVNLLSLGLGLTLGLLIGLIPIPLPGGMTFTLGYAGGPLIVALILGARRRTGSLIWTLPYSANLTLRQAGLMLLLAGIGVRSGYIFFSTFSQSGGLLIFGAGALITAAVAFLTLWIGYKLFRIPFPLISGILAGLQTQPAVLGYALEQSRNEAPNIGYALVFPIATIAKIVVVQVLYLVMS